MDVIYKVALLVNGSPLLLDKDFTNYGEAKACAADVAGALDVMVVAIDAPTSLAYEVTTLGDPGTSPRFQHSSCSGCLFVGRIGTRDAWYCEDSYTLMLRHSDDASDYESMNLETYVDHLMRHSMNRWALVVAKAYACGHISDQRILGHTEVK